uniref:Uncharacterized protein n=1 Tax=Anabas testudineus TaxID=64144 RepID=A0A3Q1JQR1_ANATE
IKLKGFGQTEVYSPEECDYLVVFCPVASRVQTDVNEALDKTSAFGNKPIILVVMHHTFDPNHILPRGSGLETNPNVHLTVNCLFHENRFLQCASNDEAFRQVQRCLGVSQPLTTMLYCLLWVWFCGQNRQI